MVAELISKRVMIELRSYRGLLPAPPAKRHESSSAADSICIGMLLKQLSSPNTPLEPFVL